MWSDSLQAQPVCTQQPSPISLDPTTRRDETTEPVIDPVMENKGNT